MCSKEEFLQRVIQRTSHPPVWRIETRDPFIDKASKLLTRISFLVVERKKISSRKRRVIRPMFWIKRDKSRDFLSPKINDFIINRLKNGPLYFLIHIWVSYHVSFKSSKARVIRLDWDLPWYGKLNLQIEKKFLVQI